MSKRYLIEDQKSFVKLPKGTRPESLKFIGHLFATDGRSVFCTRGVLKDVDASNFRVLEESSEPDFDGGFVSAYAITSQKALYVDELHAPRFFAPKQTSALRVIAPHFATDEILVFSDGIKIPGADPRSFKPLTSDYSTDIKHCYFRTARIVQADPSSFVVLEDATYRNLFLSYDRSSLYYHERPVVALSGRVPELCRGEKGWITGVCNGEREWTMSELSTLYDESIHRKRRSIEFAENSSSIRYTEAMFLGLEEELGIFLMLCSHKTINAYEEFTRGKRGEKAILRAIVKLNDHLPQPLALVSPSTIVITPEGVAAYHQFGPVVDRMTAIFSAMRKTMNFHRG